MNKKCELTINGSHGAYISDSLKASFGLHVYAPALREKAATDAFLHQIGECYRLSSINIQEASEKPATHFQGIKDFAEMLIAISNAVQGWVFACVHENDPCIFAWLDAGFLPADTLVSKKTDTKIYLMFKRCGLPENSGKCKITKDNNCAYKTDEAEVSVVAQHYDAVDIPPEVRAECPVLWDYFSDAMMLEDIKLTTSRRSPIIRNDFIRDFMVQCAYQWPEQLVCIPVPVKDRLRFIAAVDAGYIPVCIYQESYIFMRSVSWYDVNK